MTDYIKGLKLNGRDILKTRKRTGFKGFLISMTNVRNIYNDHIVSGHFDELPTFNLSQDPLESLFSRVRYLNGNNDNPTVEQFSSSIRKLLIHNEFCSSEAANCRDDLNILVVSSTTPAADISEPETNDEMKNKQIEALNNIDRSNINVETLESLLKATIHYRAGLIEQKVENIGWFNCEECKKVFTENEKVSNDCIQSVKMNTPCISTVLVCRIAERYMNEFKNSMILFNYKLVKARILDDIEMEHLFEKSFTNCSESHKEYLCDLLPTNTFE